jgi:IclR family mhp operon transcriptional activator
MVKSIEALARGIQVLDELRDKSPMSLADLHRTTNINKATLLRILKTLQESGWIYRSLGDSQYRLSYSLQQIKEVQEQSLALAELASPIIKDLQRDLQWPSDIAVRDNLTMKVVESSRPQATFILNREQIGIKPAMLFSAVGRAYLAFCSKEEREEIIKGLKAAGGKEGRLAHDFVWLEQLLRKTKEQGFAEREANYWGISSTDGRRVEAIAVPIIHKDKVIACLTVVWPEGNVETSNIRTLFLPRLQSAAKQISGRLP